jgi:hypothetical protein
MNSSPELAQKNAPGKADCGLPDSPEITVHALLDQLQTRPPKPFG